MKGRWSVAHANKTQEEQSKDKQIDIDDAFKSWSPILICGFALSAINLLLEIFR